MAKIKVTGYIYTEDLDQDDVDLGHEMGLSSKGYDKFTMATGNPLGSYMDDVEFELQDE